MKTLEQLKRFTRARSERDTDYLPLCVQAVAEFAEQHITVPQILAWCAGELELTDQAVFILRQVATGGVGQATATGKLVMLGRVQPATVLNTSGRPPVQTASEPARKLGMPAPKTATNG